MQGDVFFETYRKTGGAGPDAVEAAQWRRRGTGARALIAALGGAAYYDPGENCHRIKSHSPHTPDTRLRDGDYIARGGDGRLAAYAREWFERRYQPGGVWGR